MKKSFWLVLLVFAPAMSSAQFKSTLEDGFFDRPLVTGRQGMVTSLHPLSSMAGMRILMAGGNAFDAAVATALASGVVDPKNSTLGGNGFATVYVAKDKAVRALNFFGPSPKSTTIDKFEGKDYNRGFLSTPVPSNLKGYQELLESYGTMSWEEVLAPAIELAEHGYVYSDFDAGIIAGRKDLMTQFPTTAAVFFPAGEPIAAGAIFRQPDLARTLKAIAKDGPDVFYKGRIARTIAAFFKENGGLLSLDDLATYEAEWVEPIRTDYRGYSFFTQPPNSSAIALLMQLNLLEGYDLEALGHNSPEYLSLLGQVIQLALADRNRHVTDPEFLDIPIDLLLSKEYAADRRQHIEIGRALAVAEPGDLPRQAQHSNTTHMTVVDSDGNMVALTQTLGAWFGSALVVADTGVIFSNQMRHLHLDENSPSSMGPGKRPRSNQSPTIVLRDGKPFMAIGTPGGDGIWQRLTQVIVNIIDFDMDIQTAISAPRMVYGGYQETGTEIRPEFIIENRIAPEVVEALEGYGFALTVRRQDEGRVNGVMIDPVSGYLLGGADPRAVTYAIGW
jgi:gamma-glutamyltranspeptidase / glutathione hydrolase